MTLFNVREVTPNFSEIEENSNVHPLKAKQSHPRFSEGEAALNLSYRILLVEGNGWGGANVFEPFIVVEEYNAEWVKPPKISDCTEVARLQKEQSMTYEQLAEHFKVSTSEIYRSLRKAANGKITEVRV